jgi:hypothetical protein
MGRRPTLAGLPPGAMQKVQKVQKGGEGLPALSALSAPVE